MPRLITIELDDEIYEPLMQMSAQVRRTPQEVVAELVAYAINQLQNQQGGGGQRGNNPPPGHLGDGGRRR